MEGFEDVGPSLVADGEATKAGEPGESSLHHPTMPSETLAAVDTASCDTRDDATVAAGPAAARKIVGFVGVQLGRSSARPAPALADRRHGIEHRLQHPAVVDVGRGQGKGEGNPAGIDEKVALAARLAAIGRIRAGELAPLFAGTLAPSRAQRRQSIAFARPSRSSRTRCSRAHTPVCCQSRRRRQQVIPQPQPISCGSISQGRPERSTNRMPVSAARSETGGRPPFGRGFGGGKRGSISAHNASGRRGLAMPDQSLRSVPVPGSVRCS